MSSPQNDISIIATTKIFNAGSPNEVMALQNIDLDILSGEFVSLIGPSGCGKSTLLRLIGDLTPPTTGEIIVKDKPASEARLARDYGMVFQQATLYDWRTVSKNIQLPLEIMGYSRQKRRERATEMLELVQLDEFTDHYPWQLSGGMQQRVAIARSLAFEPSILLMDEPFGALDEMTRERMQMELLRIWAQTHTTIVFVTHSIAEAAFLSNRVVVMSARPGQIRTIIDIDLPQPRDAEVRRDPAFFEKLTEVRSALREEELEGIT